MMTNVFNTSLAVYLGALVIGAVGLFVKHRLPQTIASVLIGIGAALLTGYIGLRWVEAERAPFSNMFESLVLFAWTIAVVFLFVQRKAKLGILPAASALAIVLTLAYASKEPHEIEPLVPALQSNWLSVHVFTCFLGYGGFAVSFIGAVSYLVGTSRGGTLSGDAQEVLDTTIAKTISFGFLFLSLGIITGSVWANSAWGSYWSWDPKETWSLITWIIYAIFLHCRFVRGWHGTTAAWISVVGFGSVLFTYFGVNYLLSGLHSYA